VIGAGIHFIVVIVGHNSNGWRIALPSAVMGALAAPMIFELPLNLLMMTRAHPALPSDPVLYRILFFAPLLLIEVITLSLLTLSPAVRLSRATLWFVAAMLAVFAVGALVRLGYPPAPVPAALNVATKILALIATLSLFVRPRAGSSTGATLRPARAPAASAARTGVT
jgi:hypothetical protein